MKSGVIHFDVKEGQLDQFRDKWDSISERLHGEKGWMGCVLLSQPQSGKCIGIGLWESEQAARNFQTTDKYRQFMSEFEPFLLSEPHRGVYDFQADMPEDEELERRSQAA